MSEVTQEEIKAQVPEEREIATRELSLAVEGDDDRAVEAAIETWGDVRSKDEAGNTPLHVAAGRGREAVVCTLLARGAEVEVESNFGYTPLHWAAASGSVGCVSALLDAGADVNVGDNYLCTPLHVASRYGHLPCTKLLVERGADLNSRTSDDRTPLTIAELNNQHRVRQYLETVGGNR